MRVIAHGGVRIHLRESALKDDSEKNPLPHRGVEPVSAACQSDAVPTELHSRLKGLLLLLPTDALDHSQCAVGY